MSRELKRVRADFNWPLNKVWVGYLNPHGKTYKQCEACKGNGTSPEYRRLHDRWYGNVPFSPSETGSRPWTPQDREVWLFAERNVRRSPDFYWRQAEAKLFLSSVRKLTLNEVIQVEAERMCELFNSRWCYHLSQEDVDALIESDRLWEFTRVPRTREHREIVKRRVASGRCNSWLPFSNGYRPMAREVNRWSIRGSLIGPSPWPVIEAACKRKGLPAVCPVCQGEGGCWPDEADRLAYENWQKEEPPVGDAYQIWETVSEGAPISPPFMSPDALASWMTAMRPNEGSVNNWLQFIHGPGWTPSAVAVNGQLASSANIMELLPPEEDVSEEEKPRLGIRDQAAVYGMRLIGSRKSLRKRVRQRRRNENQVESQ
jgi:hypothetical protein